MTITTCDHNEHAPYKYRSRTTCTRELGSDLQLVVTSCRIKISFQRKRALWIGKNLFSLIPTYYSFPTASHRFLFLHLAAIFTLLLGVLKGEKKTEVIFCYISECLATSVHKEGREKENLRNSSFPSQICGPLCLSNLLQEWINCNLNFASHPHLLLFRPLNPLQSWKRRS